jgi:hypothetical protein
VANHPRRVSVRALQRRLRFAEELIRAQDRLMDAMYNSNLERGWPKDAGHLHEVYEATYGVDLYGNIHEYEARKRAIAKMTRTAVVRDACLAYARSHPGTFAAEWIARTWPAEPPAPVDAS